MNRSVLLLTAGLALAGCAGAARFPALEATRRTTVLVSNHNWATAKVYLLTRNGARIRIATVESETEQRVPLPRTVDLFGNDVGFELQLIGSGVSYRIDPLMLWPGTVIRVNIQNALSLSNVMVLP